MSINKPTETGSGSNGDLFGWNPPQGIEVDDNTEEKRLRDDARRIIYENMTEDQVEDVYDAFNNIDASIKKTTARINPELIRSLQGYLSEINQYTEDAEKVLKAQYGFENTSDEPVERTNNTNVDERKLRKQAIKAVYETMEPEQHKKIQENFHLIEEIVLEAIKKSEEKRSEGDPPFEYKTRYLYEIHEYTQDARDAKKEAVE